MTFDAKCQTTPGDSEIFVSQLLSRINNKTCEKKVFYDVVFYAHAKTFKQISCRGFYRFIIRREKLAAGESAAATLNAVFTYNLATVISYHNERKAMDIL